MFRSAWFIARKDVAYLIRRRETVMWTFIMPIVFFYFIGTITGGFAPGAPGTEPIAVRVPASAGFLAEALETRLTEAGFVIERPASDEAFDTFARRLTVPEHFTDSLLAGRTVTLTFRRRGESLSADYDQFRVQRGAYTVLADIVASRERDGTVTPATLAALDSMPRAITLNVRPAGKRVEIPTGFAQAIPGTMVMFTLLILLTSGAVLLVVERREGLLRRLAATPMTRGSIVLGKWGGRMALAIVQIGFAMLAGTLLFKMNWGPSLPAIGVMLLVYAGFIAALGLVLGTLARTESQAVGIGVMSANVLAALGGCWWPIEVTPQWMQHFALFLPTGIAMNGMHRLVNFQLEPIAVLPHVLVLATAGLIAGWVAAKLFRFQ